MCPFCPDTALDPHGHHAVTCRHGGDVVIRHNRLRGEVFDLCRHAHLSVSVEGGHGLSLEKVLDLTSYLFSSAQLNNASQACMFLNAAW